MSARGEAQSGLYEGNDWRISSKALELLQCFMSGFDDVVMRIALQHASQRRTPNVLPRVEARDIELAAKSLLEQIGSQADLSDEIRNEIGAMVECLQAKSKELR